MNNTPASLPSPLLIVSDRGLCSGTLETQVEALFSAGARWLWFRDKDLPHNARKALALRLMDITARYGGTFSLGGDVDLAAAIGATAAHVSTPDDVRYARQKLGDRALIGMSAHTPGEIAKAKDVGANYVTLSPIYETASKPGYGPALGPRAINHAEQYDMPVIALGGIDLERLTEVRQAGATGAAMMGAAMSAEHPARFMKEFAGNWH